jgi:hypothetical protein
MQDTNQNNPNTYRHTHNGIDSPFLGETAPIALTAPVAGVLSSGGTAVLQNFDSSVIQAMRTRLDELEAHLKNLNILK